MIEFDHHSGVFLTNELPAKFHIHTIVRTPNGNDYGMDLLRMHYAADHHEGAQPGVPGGEAGHKRSSRHTHNGHSHPNYDGHTHGQGHGDHHHD